jgi:hypothetical protein
VSPDPVDELRSLPHQQVTGPKHQTRRLLLFALNGHEPHARPLRCFADRLGIDRVVLLPFHKRLYIGGRDQSNFMAKLGELTGPVMGSATCLQSYRATRLGREEIQQLSSADPFAEYSSPFPVCSMSVENLLGDVQTDYANLRHGRLP